MRQYLERRRYGLGANTCAPLGETEDVVGVYRSLMANLMAHLLGVNSNLVNCKQRRKRNKTGLGVAGKPIACHAFHIMFPRRNLTFRVDRLCGRY